MPVLCCCRSLAISVNEEQLALSLSGGPAFTLALNNQELMKTDDMNFELLGAGVHTAGEVSQHQPKIPMQDTQQPTAVAADISCVTCLQQDGKVASHRSCVGCCRCHWS